MNKCIFEGRLTKDVREDKNGAVYFTLAVDRNYKSKDGKKLTDYPEIQRWGNQAKFAKKYFKKGTGALAVCELNTSPQKDEKGKTIGTKHLFKASELEFPKGNKSSSEIEKGNA